jgi:hypothetical protein
MTKTGPHWIVGNRGSDSEALTAVLQRIRNESRRKRIRLKWVWLLWSWIVCGLVDVPIYAVSRHELAF